MVPMSSARVHSWSSADGVEASDSRELDVPKPVIRRSELSETRGP